MAQGEDGPIVSAMTRYGDAAVRIEWLGDVVRRTAHRMSPNIRVAAAKLDDAGQRELLQFEVPVSFLRLFRVGDVWRRGRCVGSTAVERTTFKDLVVDDGNSDVVPCGLSAAGEGGAVEYELPFNLFDWHRNHTLSFVVKVSLPDGGVLLVPSLEVVRFYFGASGALLNRLFEGVLHGEQLWQRYELRQRDGTASLFLSPGLPGPSAATVARIALDRAARRAFRQVMNSGVASAARGQRWYPRSALPIVGKTDLTAEGLWLERPQGNAFLAFRLISCTHPFPFDRLFYRTVDDVISVNRAGHSASEPPGKMDPEAGPGAASGTDHHDLDRASRRGALAPEAVTADQVPDAVPFPDLERKAVRKVKGPQRAGFQRMPSATIGGQPMLVVQPEGGGDRLRPVELTGPVRALQVRPPTLLVDVLAACNRRPMQFQLAASAEDSLEVFAHRQDDEVFESWWTVIRFADGDHVLGHAIAIANEALQIPIVISECSGDAAESETLVAECAQSLSSRASSIPTVLRDGRLLMGLSEGALAPQSWDEQLSELHDVFLRRRVGRRL